MALPDLRDLIETRVPSHRAQLETSYINLDNVAAFCEQNYMKQDDKSAALEETKQYALQSLASVAYQINTLARDLLDMLSLQTDKIFVLASNVENIKMIVNINKEKMARREIGALTTNKSISKQPKIISPPCQEAIPRYKRSQIDFTLLDQVGHGVKTEAPRTGMVSRASSNLSSSNNYGYYGQYERTANISNNTLSRSSLRSGPTGQKTQNDHYRVPTVMPMLDPGRYSFSVASQFCSENERVGAGNITGSDGGSIIGSSDYGCASYSSGTINNSYGTLRVQQFPKTSTNIESLKSTSPELPPPPAIGSQNFPFFSNNNARIHENSRPISDEEPLPPPPPLASTNDLKDDYDSEEVRYLEKAIALYDYEADKPDELTLRENCVVYVLRKNDDGWFEGILDGVTGLFPGNYVKSI
ncbi:unnamed protein product [Auanema sp. JU1783]|nr:unnamed protein product [Auanema sp. JU1783]